MFANVVLFLRCLLLTTLTAAEKTGIPLVGDITPDNTSFSSKAGKQLTQFDTCFNLSYVRVTILYLCSVEHLDNLKSRLLKYLIITCLFRHTLKGRMIK